MLAHHDYRSLKSGVIHVRAGDQQLTLQRIYVVAHVTLDGKI
jgi:hypothetical protein